MRPSLWAAERSIKSHDEGFMKLQLLLIKYFCSTSLHGGFLRQSEDISGINYFGNFLVILNFAKQTEAILSIGLLWEMTEKMILTL